MLSVQETPRCLTVQARTTDGRTPRFVLAEMRTEQYCREQRVKTEMHLQRK